ncbi:SDR family NAD(P)-dependent oxidoreductase [Haliangium ochraceum]|uniref:Short-chain dehydrogenase/reductase SDR n=1 Tax=Haliangium ochraceum (strain DSM 14365 / JCM 11303 / SMP-2) TaxID=502025 RepID=D0LT81_HALO1|nr:SDR family NAD(P)-dependent oxidoreductase [Haliangium ochraceum]ACY19217.1 short-chain dehydrogenase/reductase SDR [Haliangium ochraceum DSM 14365]
MSRVAVITGANRGLGFALVQALCRAWSEDDVVYLAARDAERGERAVAELAGETPSPRLGILDLAAPATIEAFAGELRERHGGIDVLIQNAAYAARPGVPGAEQVRVMVDTNNRGTVRLLQAMRPLLRDGARVLVIASGFGTATQLTPQLRERFDTQHMSFADLDALMDAYAAAVEDGSAAEQGWPEWINIPSKIGQVAAMRIFARELADAGAPRDVLVNAVCPGWILTEASEPYLEQMPHLEARSPEDAAAEVLALALLPPGTETPRGELVQGERVIPFY